MLTTYKRDNDCSEKREKRREEGLDDGGECMSERRSVGGGCLEVDGDGGCWLVFVGCKLLVCLMSACVCK